MKGGQRHRLVEDANPVGDTKREEACATGKFRRHDAVEGAVVEEAKALIDRWRTHQSDLAIFDPVSSALVQFIDWLAGGKTQGHASHLLVLKGCDRRVVSHKQARDHFIKRLREE